jgi:thymidine kinase
MPLTLILGAMFSGKTTELLKHRHGRTLIINHEFDTRTSGVKTHDGIEVQAHKCSVLPVLPEESAYDTVLIDEAQFFASLDGVENLAPNVVVAGLSGDYMRRPFGKILDLIPKASKVIFLTARCSCGERAPFTKRASADTSLVSVDAKYLPVCEECYKN